MNSTAIRIIFAFLAGLPVITSPSCAQTTAKKETEGQALVRSIAEKIIIDRLEFKDADLSECLSYLRKKSVENSPEKIPERQGLGFINACKNGAKPITISLRNVSLWSAVQHVAAAAGVEATIGEYKIIIHEKGAKPVQAAATPGVAAFEKSAV